MYIAGVYIKHLSKLRRDPIVFGVFLSASLIEFYHGSYSYEAEY